MAIIKEAAPNAKIPTDFGVKKVVACVEAPTVSPIKIVTMSIIGPLAVSAKRLVTVLSFSKLPKKSIPNNGIPLGTIKVVSIKPTIGNRIFSSLETWRGGFILITLSFFVVSKRITGG